MKWIIMQKEIFQKWHPSPIPPFLYSDYQDSAVLVLVTWDQKGNEPNLLETVFRPKKVSMRLVPLLRTI